jgi:outer membrane murein-binding lipoprotein Lpp
MKFNMDIKTLIFIVSTACALAGFYYDTKAKLDTVEMEMSLLQGQVRALKSENKRINKSIRSLRKGQSK